MLPTQPSQPDGQLDHDADYQTAYQSARTIALNGGLGLPIASLRAGPSHRPTVDGMEGARAPNLGPIWAQRPRLGITERLLDRWRLLHPRWLQTTDTAPPIWGSRGRRFRSRQPDKTMADCHAAADPGSSV